MTDHPEGRTLPPFPINDETIAAIRHALDTAKGHDADGNLINVGGDFTLPQLLDFYSGSDDSRGTYVGDGELIPGIRAPIYEMWDQYYTTNDVIRALLDTLEARATR